MEGSSRRHDIDWLRVIAIAILIIYHATVSFQPWALEIAFIQSKESIEWLWIPMELVNIWRIPLLFFVSGMGVCFAMRKRNWQDLFLERLRRIFVPLIFGVFVIVPLHLFVLQAYYKNLLMDYLPHPGHLWFLGNIMAYVILCLPLFYFIKGRPDNAFIRLLKSLLKTPLGLVLVGTPFIIEAVVIAPKYFSMYAGTLHGFFIGLLAFFFGYCFVFIGDVFFQLVNKYKFLLLVAAFILYLNRLIFYGLVGTPLWLISVESMLWLYAVFGFSYRYLNRPSRLLSNLSPAVYPVYIVHMFFQYLVSTLFLEVEISTQLQLLGIISTTLLLSWISYDLVFRRIKYLRPLFGLNFK